MDLQVGWGGPLGNRQGEDFHVSQVGGDSDTCLHTVALCVGGLRKGTRATVYSSVWEEAVPQLLPGCQTFSSSLYATDSLQGAAWVLEPRGSESM